MIVAGAALLVGLYSGYMRNGLLAVAIETYLDFNRVISTLRSDAGTPAEFLQPSRKPGAGVTVNELAGDDSLVLLVGYFDGGNNIRLIRRDGSVVAQWPVRFSELFPETPHMREPPRNDLGIDLHGALINEDGSVVFNFEAGGSVKLSRCGAVEWTLAELTHHSVERSARGGYWIPGREIHGAGERELYPPFSEVVGYGLKVDELLHVSESGEVLERKPVVRVLYDNGLMPLLTATGYTFRGAATNAVDGVGTWLDDEIVHMNKIAELPPDIADRFPLFEAGDLAVSLRDYNLVFVVDPDDWRIKWHRTGPWVRQHDPLFTADGRISIFNNNVHPSQYTPGVQRDPSLIEGSNILEIDPAAGTHDVVYGDRPGEEMLTFIRGKHQRLPDGHIMIAEFEAGRAFEVDVDRRIVWEYINRYDAEHVAEITGARVYPRSYFAVTDWSCPQE
jgi:hypothetical protein